jgi:hypothetical protein
MPSLTSSRNFCLLLVGLWYDAVLALKILQPPYMANATLDTPQLFGPTTFNETVTRAQVVLNCCTQCDAISDFSLPTSAFVPLANCPLESMSRNAQSLGYANCFIIAVGVVSSEPGTLYFLVDGSNRSNILIPVFEISSADYAPIQAAIRNGTQVLLVATMGDPNAWVTFYTGPAGIVFAVVFVSISAVLAIFAMVKIVLILRAGMKVLSVPVIALFIEFFASVLRCFVTVDIIGAFRFLPWPAHTVISVTGIPLTMSATILIAFYWHEMISSFKITSTTWIQKFQVLFWILCVILVSLSVVLAVLIGVNVISNVAIAIMSIVYVIIALGTGLYFFIVGGRTIRFLRHFKRRVVSKTNVPKKILKKTTNLVICNGIGNMIFIVGVILFIIYQDEVIGIYIAVLLYYIGLLLITFSHVMAFNPPSKKVSTSSSLSTEKGSRPGVSRVGPSDSRTDVDVKVVTSEVETEKKRNDK